jgi:hypothetical protein
MKELYIIGGGCLLGFLVYLAVKADIWNSSSIAVFFKALFNKEAWVILILWIVINIGFREIRPVEWQNWKQSYPGLFWAIQIAVPVLAIILCYSKKGGEGGGGGHHVSTAASLGEALTALAGIALVVLAIAALVKYVVGEKNWSGNSTIPLGSFAETRATPATPALYATPPTRIGSWTINAPVAATSGEWSESVETPQLFETSWWSDETNGPIAVLVGKKGPDGQLRERAVVVQKGQQLVIESDTLRFASLGTNPATITIKRFWR